VEIYLHIALQASPKLTLCLFLLLSLNFCLQVFLTTSVLKASHCSYWKDHKTNSESLST
jgi:hypothetical protein